MPIVFADPAVATSTSATEPRLLTERLELRYFRRADHGAYAAMWEKPEFYRYLGDGTPKPADFAARFATSLSFSRGVFAVVVRATRELIGHCGIRPIPDGRIELLYAYDPTAWGQGYATEAARAVLEYGRAHFEIDELIAMAYPANAASGNVIRKLGFTLMGQEEHFGAMLDVYSLTETP
ncbi:MAG: GNAT family N-acetyltransferase [Promicromonosporaceae bacterium]|nr:GNAT family N-acetyltransferase [Promicromonosporaceae bacterium]